MNKKEIANELKPITKTQAIEDFLKLKSNLKNIKDLSLRGIKFVDFFTFLERLNTRGNKKLDGKAINFFDMLNMLDKIKHRGSLVKMIEYEKKRNNNEYACLYSYFRMYFGSINIFSPSVSISIYKKFSITSVLDFTMGWGGRLVGACALDIPHYIGIDNNKNLIKPYEDMIETITPHTKTKIDLIFEDALNVDYSSLDYDFVLTSPPYYNIELYGENNERTKDDWNKNFYKPIFEITYRYLKKGGHYCLNIPIDVYENNAIPVLGKPEIILPFPKRNMNRKVIQREEFIYVWVK